MLVLVAVSQATLDSGSCSRQASRMASDTWSHSCAQEEGGPQEAGEAVGVRRVGRVITARMEGCGFAQGEWPTLAWLRCRLAMAAGPLQPRRPSTGF